MKLNNGFTIFVIVFLVVGAGIFLIKDSNNKGNSVLNDAQEVQGQIQKVVLSQNGYNYKDATVEAGRPIEISADSSVTGCLRSVAFNLEGKRYTKYLQTPEDTLELPALSKGTYTYSCSMGMGYGKLIVK
jgi:hypothetical protein